MIFYGRLVRNGAEFDNSRWRPRWPPKHIWSIISGTNRDRNIILVSRIGFLRSGYSKRYLYHYQIIT